VVQEDSRPCQWVQESWPDSGKTVERAMPNIQEIVEKGCLGRGRELAITYWRLNRDLVECCRGIKSTSTPP
jgi:hypothetical protein